MSEIKKHVHSEVIQRVQGGLPDDITLYRLAELFKVFGDSTRIQIIYALSEEEMCVYDISKLLNVSQSATSHQLRILKQASLVKFRKEGRTVFYSLADSHVKTILAQGYEHILE